MMRAAQMVEKHLDGSINAIVLKATNALSESMNAKIQKIKSQVCGALHGALTLDPGFGTVLFVTCIWSIRFDTFN